MPVQHHSRYNNYDQPQAQPPLRQQSHQQQQQQHQHQQQQQQQTQNASWHRATIASWPKARRTGRDQVQSFVSVVGGNEYEYRIHDYPITFSDMWDRGEFDSAKERSPQLPRPF